MKLHSSWLAVGMLVFAVFACNIGKNSNSSDSNGPISEGHMAKDKNGEPGDQTNTFNPSDRTVHCVVTLKEPKEGTRMKFAWWIVDAQGTKNEKMKEIEYTTGPGENLVHGHLTLPRDWPTGKYKCEVDVNDKLEKTIDYWVK
ncbi:MAG TPA: hypothetical protein VHD88_02315 [Pyrinomonadaceae bacterium]|nr:hypothetical protein [Pyrinomonadaceae bacterium]